MFNRKRIEKLEEKVAILARTVERDRERNWNSPPLSVRKVEAVREGDDLVVYKSFQPPHQYGSGQPLRVEIARAKTPAGLRKILDPKFTEITIVTPEVREEV
jgi:hypothetical protein